MRGNAASPQPSIFTGIFHEKFAGISDTLRSSTSMGSDAVLPRRILGSVGCILGLRFALAVLR